MEKAKTPRRRNRVPHDGRVSIRGFYRVNIVEHNEDGSPRIVGDSGWVKNQIVAAGIQNLANLLYGNAGGSTIIRGALGTGTAPAPTTTSLPGEFGDASGSSSTANRSLGSVTTATTTASSVNVSYVFSWGSTQSFNQSARTIQNIGLLPNSNTLGTLFAGATYTASQLSTNQDVKAEDVNVVFALAA